MKRALLVVAIVIIAPLLAWLDLWLAIQFGNWVNALSGQEAPGAILGFFAFFVLVGTQTTAAWLGLERKSN